MYNNDCNNGQGRLTSSSDPYPFAIDEAYDTYKVLVESGTYESLLAFYGR
jgi:hypothetical protein